MYVLILVLTNTPSRVVHPQLDAIVLGKETKKKTIPQIQIDKILLIIINRYFNPIVMSACGAMGPSIVAFLKEVYGRAKGANKLLIILAVA